ncbi:UPF0001 protein YlmE [Chlamydiales bacterium SCGC AB-751-O23]|nr:UPF0001 protein YlmE [Chlamydiales bacterium SCGC AB-751-O23]
MVTKIANNLEKVKKNIDDILKKNGRSAKDIALICVSKFQDKDKILEAYETSHRDFGENRVQEFLEKQSFLPKDIRWHFIGTLQKNKVRKVIGKCFLIHSVDSFELAEKISNVSLEVKLKTQILIQVNTSSESSKNGLSRTCWEKHWEKLLDLKGVEIQGLMTIASNTADQKIVKENFKALKEFLKELNLKYYRENPMKQLSMGMSGDYEQAIEEGASYIRVGSNIFGLRCS